MDKKKDYTNEKIKKEVPVRGDTVGIRATLNNMGFSNSSIGYNEADGTVTLGGKAFMKPKYVDENRGISYSTKNDIQKSLVDFYRDSSNPIVRVSDAYAAAAGKNGLTADALSYGNGTVMIGGTPLDTLYIDDEGKAWAWQSDVDSLTSAYANRSGVRSPDSVLNEYSRRYMSDVRDLLRNTADRESFSYDPESDPVYKAYREKYILEGDRASKNAIADYSANTGGYVNSAAVTAGSLANQYYAKQLSDKLPDLAQAAYERYLDEYNLNLDTADKLLAAYKAEYSNAADANNQLRKNANNTADSAVARDNAAYNREFERQKADRAYEQDEFERYWDNLLNQQSYDTQERDNYWSEIFNAQKRTSNTYQNTAALLDNKEKEIYLEYYKRLLESELEGSNLDNDLKGAKLRVEYGY
ncbi:MAG: hypothetical protein Q4E94_06240 [Clostridia bacterium]|nr:hypothetical protein [Clostridia bacterium]